MTDLISTKVLEISTGHLSDITRQRLEKEPGLAGAMEREFGWMFHTGIACNGNWEAKPDLPRDLLHVLRFARANDMSWVYFDQDEAELDLLPVYLEDSCQLGEQQIEGLALLPGDAKHPEAVDPNSVTLRQLDLEEAGLAPRAEEVLQEGDYVVKKGEAVWLTVGKASLRIEEKETGVAVQVHRFGAEDEAPLEDMFCENDWLDEAPTLAD